MLWQELNKSSLSTLRFFKKNKSSVYAPILNKEITLSWEFKNIISQYKPIKFVSCKLKSDCQDVPAYGYGDAFFLKNALKKSFSESWERLWYSLLSEKNPWGVNFSSTNGFAAGVNEKVSITKARQELIERYLLLRAWQEKSGWERHVFKSKLAGFLEKYYTTSALWNIKYYIIKHKNLGAVLAAYAFHEKYGCIFDTTYIDNNIIDAEIKLIQSLVRGFAYRENKKIPLDFTLPEKAGPQDHFIFYANPVNLTAFNFLSDKQSSLPLKINDFEDVSCIVHQTVYNGEILPAVAVAYNEKWPQLVWGKQSIAGLNPWPHPLA